MNRNPISHDGGSEQGRGLAREAQEVVSLLKELASSCAAGAQITPWQTG